MSSITPTPEAIQQLLQSPDSGKVVMLNMLKFKSAAGAASYAEYGRRVAPMVEALGGRIVYAGPVVQTVIGSETWDAIVLVEYPSRKAFLQMAMSAEYQAIHHFRDEGLERTELYATTQRAELLWHGKK
jgi:uncharacterized protein (DUF1330 family)